MRWRRTIKFDQRAREIADRHYSRRKIGAEQFAPPGRVLVLVTEAYDALWVSHAPRFVMHRWAPCWGNPLFRNEGAHLSSELVGEALAATRAAWGTPPEPWGMITFVDPVAVRSRNPGFCYKVAGFRSCGRTEGAREHGRRELLALSCPVDRWPAAEAARGGQLRLGLST